MKLSERSIPIKDAPIGAICVCELNTDLGIQKTPIWIPEDKSSGLGYVECTKINSDKSKEHLRVTGDFMVYIKENT